MRRTYEQLATKVYQELKINSRIRKTLDLDTSMSTSEVSKACGYSPKYRRVYEVLFDLQDKGFVCCHAQKYRGVADVTWRWYLTEDFPYVELPGFENE